MPHEIPGITYFNVTVFNNSTHPVNRISLYWILPNQNDMSISTALQSHVMQPKETYVFPVSLDQFPTDGCVIGYVYDPNAPQPSISPPHASASDIELSIARVDPDIEPYLDYKISNPNITNNTISCDVTLTWQSTTKTLSGYTLSLAVCDNSGTGLPKEVSMFKAQAIIVAYKGPLPIQKIIGVYGHSILSSTSVVIPTLGNGVDHYDFSLTCPLQK